VQSIVTEIIRCFPQCLHAGAGIIP